MERLKVSATASWFESSMPALIRLVRVFYGLSLLFKVFTPTRCNGDKWLAPGSSLFYSEVFPYYVISIGEKHSLWVIGVVHFLVNDLRSRTLFASYKACFFCFRSSQGERFGIVTILQLRAQNSLLDISSPSHSFSATLQTMRHRLEPSLACIWISGCYQDSIKFLAQDVDTGLPVCCAVVYRTKAMSEWPVFGIKLGTNNIVCLAIKLTKLYMSCTFATRTHLHHSSRRKYRGDASAV